MSDCNNIMHQLKHVSIRSLVANMDVSSTQPFQKILFLSKYKGAYQLLLISQKSLCKTRDEIYNLTPAKGNNYHERIKQLKEERYKANNNVNKYEQILRNLESKQMFDLLVLEARGQHSIQMQSAGEAALSAWKENDRKKQQELRDSFQNRREENLQKQVVPPAQVCQEKNEEKTSKVKAVLASIPLSILGVFVIHLIYGLVNLIVSLVFWLISYIPIIKGVVGYLLALGDNTPDGFAMFIAAGVAYIGFMAISERIIKKPETKKLTLILTGIFLTVSNVLYVIINLAYNDPILGNVLLAIAGTIIFFRGKNE